MTMNGNNEGNNEDGKEGIDESNLNEGTDNNEGNQGQSEESNSDDGGNQGNSDGSASGDKTFTQDEVTKMMTKEKKQGRNSVYNELGIDPNDSKTIALVRALAASQKETNDASHSGASNEELDEANHRAMVAEAKAEAMMHGILPKYVDDAVALALPKVDEENDLKSVIKDLKAKYPIWAKPEEGSDNAGKKGTGSSISSSGGGKSGKQESIGARLAASRKAGKPKQSYWGKK